MLGAAVADALPLPPEMLDEKAPIMAVSVCEQNRHAHVLEHVAGDAAQHHLTQARVTVAAHDEKIGFLLVGLGQNQLPYRRPAALYRFDTRADLMTRQRGEAARAGPLAKADAELAGVDDQ